MFDSIWKKTIRIFVYINCALTGKVDAGLEFYSILGRWSEGTSKGAWVTCCLDWSPTQKNWDFDWCRNSSTDGSCSTSGYLRRRVCHYLLRDRYHLETIAWWRFCLPVSRIERTHTHSKMSTLSTNESDQTVSQTKTIHNGSIVPLPSDMCTSERRGRIPVHTGSAFSRWIKLFRRRPQPQRILHAVFISTTVDGVPPIESELTMGQLSLTISWMESWTFSDLLSNLLRPIR